MYHLGIRTRTSEDGLTWSDEVNTGIDGATNPVVIKLKDSTYLMIYGIQQHPAFGLPTEQLYAAISTDDITFTKQPADPVLTGNDNFASVPELLYLNDTTLWMYYVSGTRPSHIHTATSTDNELTWTKEEQISITGCPISKTDVDPDIIKLSDETYCLFLPHLPQVNLNGEI